jgi:SAM-dependent methyltransferase
MASPRRAEAMGFDELVPCWNGFFKEKVFFSYLRCPRCQLLFTPVFFSPDQLGELYRGMPPNMESVPESALQRTQRGYFDWLRSNATFEGDYLEMGPDVGLFVRNCVSAGGFGRYWLFEPNRDVAPALTAAMGAEDHVLVHDMTGFDTVPEATLGAAVMVHVLDHLLDPMPTLVELRRKLQPGGKLLIVTHDESSMLRRAFGKMWPPFCLQHPQLFRPETMKTMLATAGFEKIEVKRAKNYFPISFLFQHLLWAIGVKSRHAPSFDGLTVGLRLGNMMTLATA